MSKVRYRFIGTDRKRFVEFDRFRQVAGVEREDLTLLGDGRSQRFNEIVSRQDHVVRLATARLTGAVTRHERDLDLLSRKRMLGEIPARYALTVASVVTGEVELVFRRRVDRRGSGFALERFNLRISLLKAVVVARCETDLKSAIGTAARCPVKGDFRCLVCNHVYDPLL